MKITGATSTVALVLILVSSCILNAYAQTPLETQRKRALRGRADPNSTPAEVNPILRKVLDIAATTRQRTTETPQPVEISKPRTYSVRTADFYLKDGKLVFGKLITEDKNKVTIEHIDGSKIIVDTYSKRDMDPRTLQTKNVSAGKYYQDLAEYFAGRIWDFDDDPDDFIQAIRCYEKAKQFITGTSKLNVERIQLIDKKISGLKTDRQVWEREVQSRAKLKELEFKAEFQTRFNELENKIDAGTQKIDQSIQRLDKILTDIQDDHQKLEQNFPALEQDLRRQLNILADQVQANRRMLDPYYRRPRPYGYYGPGY